MIKFTIQNGQLQIKWQDLTIPLFNEIYQKDTTKEKKWAFSVLKMIYHLADETDDNTLKDRPYYSKWDDAKKASFVPNRDLTSDEEYYVEEGVKAYVECNSTVDTRTLQTYNDTIEKQRVIIDNNPPEMIRYEEPRMDGLTHHPTTNQPLPGKVSWVTNSSIINTILKDMNLVAEARDKLLQRTQKDKVGGRNKGGYKKSTSESGAIAAPGMRDKLNTGSQQ